MEHYGTSGAHRLCLYLFESGNTLIAEKLIDIPAAPASPPSTPAPVPTFVDKDCTDFRYQQDAQAYMAPGDPHRLDADGDGAACETLPSRSAPTLGYDEPECSDDRDNDGDGNVDGDDWQCATVEDDSEAIPTLGRREAKRYMRTALRRRFDGAYRHGYAKRLRGCRRLSRLRIKCRRVSWVVGDVSYAGWITIRATTNDVGRDVWRAAYRITRTNEYCLVTGGRHCKKKYRVRS